MAKLNYQSKREYDYKDFPQTKPPGERPLTVPGMALSLKEIYQRAITGRPIPDIQQELKSMSSEVTFDDVNPMVQSPDRLTESDRIKEELVGLGEKRNKREEEKAQKAKKEAAEKAEADLRAKIESEAKESSEKQGESDKKAAKD